MSHEQGMGLPESLHQLIVQLSTKLLTVVSLQLHNYSTSTLFNYKFNIGDLAHIFQVTLCKQTGSSSKPKL